MHLALKLLHSANRENEDRIGEIKEERGRWNNRGEQGGEIPAN